MRLILDMTKKVVGNLAGKFEKVKKGIGDIVGGKVLDLEIIRIRNEGKKEGWIEGRNDGWKNGKLDERQEIIRHMLNNGKNAAEINMLTGIPLEEIEAVENNCNLNTSKVPS